MTRRMLIPSLFAVGLAAGCSSRYTPVPVRGTVTLDGKPVAGATISFYNAADSPEGRMAFGNTNDAGQFELSTLGDKDGALPGNYKVVVVKWVPIKAVRMPDFPDTPDGRQSKEDYMYKVFGTGPRQKTALPEKYGSRDSTPLTCTVERGMTVDFPLTSQ